MTLIDVIARLKDPKRTETSSPLYQVTNDDVNLLLLALHDAMKTLTEIARDELEPYKGAKQFLRRWQLKWWKFQ